jgi:hypothetical protein
MQGRLGLCIAGCFLLIASLTRAAEPAVVVHLGDSPSEGPDDARPRRHKSVITAVAYSDDGGSVTTIDDAECVVVWDAATGKSRHSLLAHGPSPRLSGDGAVVTDAVAGKGCRLVETASGKVRQTLGDNNDLLRPLSLSHDGKLLAAPPSGNFLHTFSTNVWDAEAGCDRCDMEVGALAFGGALAFSRDGAFAAGVCDASWPRDRPDKAPFVCRIWDASSGDEIREMPLAKPASSVLFSPDARSIVTAGPDGLWVWETATGMPRIYAPGGPDGGLPLAFSPDGRTLAVCEIDAKKNTRLTRLLDLYSGKERFSFPGYSGGVNAAAFSPDGKRLAVGRDDSSTDVWDVSSVTDATAWATATPTPKELDALWEKLAGGDAGAAHQAVGVLASAAEQAPDYVQDRLLGSSNRVSRGMAEKLKRLIIDLDDDEYRVREKAMLELTDLGGRVAPFLRRRLKDGLSLEAEFRVKRVLMKVEKSAKEITEPVTWLRATEALERLGTPEARAALERLADDIGPGPEAAKAALDRLTKRTAAVP